MLLPGQRIPVSSGVHSEEHLPHQGCHVPFRAADRAVALRSMRRLQLTRCGGICHHGNFTARCTFLHSVASSSQAQSLTLLVSWYIVYPSVGQLVMLKQWSFRAWSLGFDHLQPDGLQRSASECPTCPGAIPKPGEGMAPVWKRCAALNSRIQALVSTSHAGSWHT